MKEQADIAQKAGYHRHDDTLPLVVAVRGQRSDICWTSIVLLLEGVCPKTCWNRVRQTSVCCIRFQNGDPVAFAVEKPHDIHRLRGIVHRIERKVIHNDGEADTP